MELENKIKEKKINNSIMFRIIILLLQMIVFIVIFISFLVKYFSK